MKSRKKEKGQGGGIPAVIEQEFFLNGKGRRWGRRALFVYK